MINAEAFEKIKILEDKYKEHWGRNVDYTIVPNGLSQEKLVKILERIVDTGESITVGYDTIRDLERGEKR